MTAMQRKRVVVCADDFGLTDAASQSILALASANAISATSCVVDGEFTQRYASALIDVSSNLSIGLHFNLTELVSSPLKGRLPAWLLRSFLLRATNRPAIAQELERQLDLFETLFKRPPQFVDGHEHVHQFPVIRDVLLEVLFARYGARVGVRCTVPRNWRGMKAQIVAGLGGRAMRRCLLEHGFYMNTDFAGVYDFTSAVPYAQRMQAWLHSVVDQGLVMCHPELPASRKTPRNARYDEHQFFASEAWRQQRETQAVKLVPFSSRTALH